MNFRAIGIVSRAYGQIVMLLAAVLFCPSGQKCFAQSVTALPHLDVNVLSGAWFEIARYPNRREKFCTADDLELIALDDKDRRLQLVDSCASSQGYTIVHNYIAKIDKSTDGKLKIPQFWPFSRPYWVLAMAPDNSWVVIGEGNHKGLWIFSRQPKLDPATLSQIEALTTASGFSAARLVFPPQQDRTTAASTAPTIDPTKHPAAAPK